MIANGVSELVQESIKLELENIKKNWGDTYNSTHEGYAVLLEEFEEVEQEVEYLQTDLRILWEKIKNNFESIENTDNAAELMCIVMNAKHLAEESIQVAAVAEKFIQTIDLKGVED